MGAAPAYSYYPERAPERSPRERISVVPGRGARTQTPTLPSNVVFLAKAAAVVLLVVSLVGFARIGLMSATISTTMKSSQLTSQISDARSSGAALEVSQSTLSNPTKVKQQAGKLVAKVRTNSFTLEDYLDQLRQLSKMGSVSSMLKMIPGLANKIKESDIDEEKMMKAQKKNEAIILSMTRMERRNPDILNASRKRRVAAGCGATVQDVNLLLKQFDQARQMMKQMMGGGKKRMRLPFGKFRG